MSSKLRPKEVKAVLHMKKRESPLLVSTKETPRGDRMLLLSARIRRKNKVLEIVTDFGAKSVGHH